MNRNPGNLHPHYPKPSSRKPQKGPESHGFHGVPGSPAPKARGKKILEGEQREELMPDADRKVPNFPREWPTEKATKAKHDQNQITADKIKAKKSAAKPKAVKAKKAVKAQETVKAKKTSKAKKAVKAKKPTARKMPSKAKKTAAKRIAVKSKKAATKERKAA